MIKFMFNKQWSLHNEIGQKEQFLILIGQKLKPNKKQRQIQTHINILTLQQIQDLSINFQPIQKLLILKMTQSPSLIHSKTANLLLVLSET